MDHPQTPTDNDDCKDIENVLTAFTSIDTSLESNAIKDCFCLGKFNPSNTRLRLLMVKFLRSADVSSILSKKISQVAYLH